MIMELCRLCVKVEKKMNRFDETFVYQYNLLTNLNVSLLDEMPQFSCKSCWDTVKGFITFREKSIKSEQTLKTMIEQKSQNIQVKLLSDTDSLIEFHTNKINISREDIGSQSASHEFPQEADPIKNEEIYIPSISKSLLEFIQEEDGGIKYKTKHKGYTDNDATAASGNKGLEIQKISSKKTRAERLSKKNVKILQNNDAVIWLCGICPKMFEKEVDVKRHLDFHKEDRQCEICKLKMNSTSQLLAHRLKHVPFKQFFCHICAKRFRSSLPLEHHYRNIHNEGDDPKLSCEICTSTFSTPKRLNYHKRQVHSSIRFFCDVCSKGFTSKGYLKSHIKHHDDTKSYVCDVCGFSCNYSGGLKNHKIWRHSQKKIHCKNCNRPFSNQRDFDRHTCKARLKVCPICGLQLTRRANLTRHMATHSDVYPYECTRCPAKYKTKSGLKAHINRHEVLLDWTIPRLDKFIW